MNDRARRLLWLDSGAALVAGTVVLVASGWLADLYRVPRGLLIGTGAVNLAYGAYSGSLVRAVVRGRELPRWRVDLLVGANAAWAVLCVGLVAWFGGEARWFAWAHLLGEAAFVGGLAAAEWRWVRGQPA